MAGESDNINLNANLNTKWEGSEAWNELSRLLDKMNRQFTTMAANIDKVKTAQAGLSEKQKKDMQDISNRQSKTTYNDSIANKKNASADLNYSRASMTRANAQNTQADASKLNAETRDYLKKSKDAQQYADVELSLQKKQWMKFKQENPYYNQFRRSGTYAKMQGLNAAGSILQQTNTVGGRVGSDALQVAATALLNPALALAEGLGKAGQAALDFSKAALEAYGSIEKIKVQMSVVYGSETQADTAFQGIKNYAVKSPFGIEQTSEMAVLLKQSGVYSSDVLDTMKMIGDVSSGNNEKMKRIANNYAQIEATGKATMLDMRQFAYAGIPIYKEVAKELGVSQTALRAMIKDGEVTNDVMEKVFKTMTSNGGVFYGAVEKGSKTLEARRQNLKDTKTLAMSAAGQAIMNFGDSNGTGGLYSGFLDWSENFYQGMEKALENSNINKNVKQIAGNNNRQQKLQALLEYAKFTGDKTSQKLIEQELKDLSSVFSPDKQRAIYENSYNSTTRGNRLHDVANLRWEKSIEIDNQIVELNKTRAKINMYSMLGKTGGDIRYLLNIPKDVEGITASQLDSYYKKQIANLQILYDKYESIDTTGAFLEHKNYTSEQKKAHKETYALNYQSTGIEQVEKNIAKSDSYATVTDTLAAEYKKTAEYKQKEIDETKKQATAAKNLATILQTTLDNDGNITKKINQLSTKNFMEAYDKGLIEITDGIDLVKDDYNDVLKTIDSWKGNVEGLATNMGYVSVKASSLTMSNGKQDNAIVTRIKRLSKDLNSNQYTDDQKMNKAVDAINSIAPAISKGMGSKNKDTAEYYRKLNAIFSVFLSKFGFNTDATKYDVNLLDSGKDTIHAIPLWKRIEASGMGLDANLVNQLGSSSEIMSTWKKFNERSTVGAGLSAYLGENGIQATIDKYVNGSNLKGRKDLTVAVNGVNDAQATTKGVFQINWAKIEQQMLDDVMNGNATSSMSKALVDSYQSTLDKIDQLAVSGWTTGENAEYSKTLNDQLKNAFSGITFDADKEGKFNALVNGEETSVKWDDTVQAFKKTSDGTIVVLDEVQKNNEILYDELKKHGIDIKGKLDKAQIGDIFITYSKKLQSDIDKANKTIRDMSIGNNAHGEVSSLYLGKEFSNKEKNTIYSKATENLSSLYSDQVENLAKQGTENKNKNETVTQEQQWAMDFVNGTSSFDQSVQLFSEIAKNFGDKEAVQNAVDAAKATVKASSMTQGSSWASSLFNGDNKILDGGFGKTNGAIWRGIYNGLGGLQGSNNFSMQRIGERNGYSGEWSENQKTAYVESFASMYKQATGKENYKGFNLDNLSQGLNSEGKLLDTKELDTAVQAFANMENSSLSIAENMESLGSSLKNFATQFASDAITSTFQTLGKSIKDGSNALEDSGENMKKLGTAALANLGTLFVQAGLSMIASNPHQWYIGAALIAAGGMASLLSGLTSDTDSEDDDETERLQSIKDQLADLLEQARVDAIYYENELRHKKAISTNDSISSQSVNDAIIAPNGNIITTHPDDYLIATKNPADTMGAVSRTPNVNMNIYNQSGEKLEVEQKQTKKYNGDIDFVAIIKTVAKDVIASSDGDAAFNARSSRLNGRSTTY